MGGAESASAGSFATKCQPHLHDLKNVFACFVEGNWPTMAVFCGKIEWNNRRIKLMGECGWLKQRY